MERWSAALGGAALAGLAALCVSALTGCGDDASTENVTDAQRPQSAGDDDTDETPEPDSDDPGPTEDGEPSEPVPSVSSASSEDPVPSGPVNPEPSVPLAPPAEPGEPPVDPEVTWHNTIAPLVSEKCSGCHGDGGIAPFALETFEQVSTLAPLLRSAIDLRIMPPWGAHDTEECQPRFGFKDDLRLSEKQINDFAAWVEAGTPEGDPATAAPLLAPPDLELTDASLSLPLPEVSVEGPSDKFLCFSVDPQLTEDAWVIASQVVPGNSAIVHHVLTYVDAGAASAELVNEDGYYECFGGPGVSDVSLLSAWAPGSVPWRAPKDVATSLPAGARLIVNVHYHPTGAGTEVDSGTRVDFAFSDQEPLYDGQMLLIGNFSSAGLLGELLPSENDPDSGVAFAIPAGATSHIERMRFVVPPLVPEGIIWAAGTHMHYVGTDMMMTVTRPSPGDQPAEECLLQTPAWDFNWQRGYLYDAPLDELPTAKTGDVLDFRCTYDNSLENPFVRDALDEQGLTAPRDVVLGEESLDEMCLGVFGVAYPR